MLILLLDYKFKIKKNLFLFVKGIYSNNINLNENNIIDVSNFLLYRNSLQNIPDEIFNGPINTGIDLSERNLSFIPSELKLFKNLVTLNLSYNLLTDFCELPKCLKCICLNDNDLKFLPEHFFNLTNLEIIELRGNILSKLPKSIRKFKNLKKLDVSHNQIFYIHSSIGELSKIEKIIMPWNKIKSLPNSINKLKNLNSINLNHNEIIKFPDNCECLFKLKELFLSNNLLTNVETVCKIKSLEMLFLNKNKISVIPDSISNLKNLKYLYLSENNISSLPDEIIKCNELIQLYLLENFFTNIETICKIKSLEMLFLDKNQILEIPDTICNLENLKYLYLSENKIKTLPTNIKNCKKLRGLNLRSNKISQISIKLFSLLSNLDLLDLRKNPILYPVDSTVIDICVLKKEMGDRLLIDNINYKKIKDIYFQLNLKPIRFNFKNLRKCKPINLPAHIYSEKELLKIINDWKEKFFLNNYKNNNKLVIIDPNIFTNKIKSFDTTILIDYIHHLYNPDDRYPLWNVPKNLIDEFRRYVGVIVVKLFSSNDYLLIEGHLNSLSTAICYCYERQKNELIFLYELLIYEDEKNLEQFQHNNLNLKQGSYEHLKNIYLYIENIIKKLIGKAKIRILMNLFCDSEDKENVHLFNYWKYILKDHIGFDVFGDKPVLLSRDKFYGRIEFGLEAFYEKFTPEWLIIELKNLINSNNNLICHITEFLYHSNIQNKFSFINCENDDILFTKSVTVEFCEFILKNMEIIIVN